MFTRARLILAAWYLVAVALIVGTLGILTYVLVRDDFDDEIDRSIRAAQSDLLSLPALPGESTRPPVSRETEHDDHDGDDFDEGDEPGAALPTDVFYVSFEGSGAVIANPRGVNLSGIDLAKLASTADRDDAWGDLSAAGVHYRLAATPWPEAGSIYLLVGRSLSARDHQLRSLAIVFSVGGIVALVMSGAAGVWLADRALVPIRHALETQQRFVSDASHELRTPLATVRANSELLLRNPDAMIESRLDHVEAIIAEADHMTRLVDDLLTLARGDEGQTYLALDELNLGHLVAEVCRDIGPLAETRGIDLTCEAGSCPVRGDRRRLRQLCVILLDNALQHTPAGGTITVTCSRLGRRSVLSVSDSGAGIAPELQSRIFERFFRADPSRTRGTGGSGLGLAIARWITETHGGRITVASRVGEGTTFTVLL